MTVAKPNNFSANSIIASASLNQNFNALFVTLGLQDYDAQHNANGSHKQITCQSLTSTGPLVATNVSLSGTMSVGGDTTFTGNVTASGNLTVAGSLTVTGTQTFTGNTSIASLTTLTAIDSTAADTIAASMTDVGADAIASQITNAGANTILDVSDLGDSLSQTGSYSNIPNTDTTVTTLSIPDAGTYIITWYGSCVANHLPSGSVSTGSAKITLTLGATGFTSQALEVGIEEQKTGSTINALSLTAPFTYTRIVTFSGSSNSATIVAKGNNSPATADLPVANIEAIKLF